MSIAAGSADLARACLFSEWQIRCCQYCTTAWLVAVMQYYRAPSVQPRDMSQSIES